VVGATLTKEAREMINKQVFQFPIIYTNPIGRIAFGWGAHETVGDECQGLKMKKLLESML
jgi:hypothetical protein